MSLGTRLMAWTTAPAEPTLLQRRAIWLLTAAVGLSRLLACSESAWHWDEFQFMSALEYYDVPGQQPHPPGYPLFIALGWLMKGLGADSFRALQILGVIAGTALFPGMVALARELRLSFTVGLSAALMLVFLPNVWFFGGTAYSDLPAAALSVWACVMLLRGCHNHRSLYFGVALLAAAAGIRSQTLLLGVAPGLLVLWCRREQTWILSRMLALGGVVLALQYGGAILAQGSCDEFLMAAVHHSRWIATVDSWRNPSRPGLLMLFDDFFITPFGPVDISVLMTLLVGASLCGVRRLPLGVAILCATFMPMAIMAWLMFNYEIIPRYSISYSPMLALLAASGLQISVFTLRHRWHGVPRGLDVALSMGIVMFFIGRFVEPLSISRGVSPPVASARWLKTHVDFSQTHVYIDRSLIAFARNNLFGYPWKIISPEVIDDSDSYVVSPTPPTSAPVVTFTRNRNRTLQSVTGTSHSVAPYSVNISRVSPRIGYHKGWYSPETDGADTWRWLGRRAIVRLRPISGPAELIVEVNTHAGLSSRAELTISLDDTPISVTKLTGQRQRLRMTVMGDSQNDYLVLTLETNRAMSPLEAGLSRDSRELGAQVFSIEWAATTHQHSP